MKIFLLEMKILLMIKSIVNGTPYNILLSHPIAMCRQIKARYSSPVTITNFRE